MWTVGASISSIGLFSSTTPHPMAKEVPYTSRLRARSDTPFLPRLHATSSSGRAKPLSSSRARRILHSRTSVPPASLAERPLANNLVLGAQRAVPQVACVVRRRFSLDAAPAAIIAHEVLRSPFPARLGVSPTRAALLQRRDATNATLGTGAPRAPNERSRAKREDTAPVWDRQIPSALGSVSSATFAKRGASATRLASVPRGGTTTGAAGSTPTPAKRVRPDKPLQVAPRIAPLAPTATPGQLPAPLRGTARHAVQPGAPSADQTPPPQRSALRLVSGATQA